MSDAPIFWFDGDNPAMAEAPELGMADWMYALSGRVYGAFTVNLSIRR